MKHLVKFDGLLEMKSMGSTDGFDQLTTIQKAVALIVFGLLRYKGHMAAEISVNDESCVITVGNRGQDNAKVTGDSKFIISSAMEVIKAVGIKNVTAQGASITVKK